MLSKIVLFAVLLLLVPSRAAAYPWMIGHGYTQCAQCHVDPSGGSALTPYGRAQGEIFLRTHYGDREGEPGKMAEFLFGAVPLPEAVIAQADVRMMFIPRPDQFQAILMQSDLRGGFETDLVKAYVSVGVVDQGALGARVLNDETGVLEPVSRDYWLGLTPAKGLLVRAGRMPLPFGVRNENHILFTRGATRTTLNDDQQLGLAVAYARGDWRGEVMGIAGNLQVSPDAYRERGYAGYLAWGPETNVEVGVSSLLTTARLDVSTFRPLTRQAHGLFGRWSPVERLSAMAEADLLLDRAGADAEATTGLASELEVDWEAAQGFHVKGGGGVCDSAFQDDSAASGRGWTALQWFFMPRVDLRIDALVGPLYCVPGATSRPMGMAQLHFYL